MYLGPFGPKKDGENGWGMRQHKGPEAEAKDTGQGGLEPEKGRREKERTN